MNHIQRVNLSSLSSAWEIKSCIQIQLLDAASCLVEYIVKHTDDVSSRNTFWQRKNILVASSLSSSWVFPSLHPLNVLRRILFSLLAGYAMLCSFSWAKEFSENALLPQRGKKPTSLSASLQILRKKYKKKVQF